MKPVLLVIGLYLIPYLCISQEVKIVTASTNSYIDLSSYFSDYNILSWAPSALRQSMNQNKQIEIEVNGQQLVLDLVEEEIFTADAKVFTLTPSGKQQHNFNRSILYTGNIKDDPDSYVKVISDDNYLSISIFQDGEVFRIHQLKRFDHHYGPEHLVIYNNKNVKKGREATCGIQEFDIEGQGGVDENGSDQSVLACYGVDLGVVADYSYYTDRGSSVQSVISYILDVIADVNTNYTSASFNDGIEYYLSEIVISTCNECDLWTKSTDPGLLLDDFTAWGQAGGFNSSSQMHSFWTNRNFNGSTVGLAWFGSGLVCGNSAYHVLQDYSADSDDLRVLTAHEMGHNWNAGHDGSSGNIMAPSVNNTNTWSTASQSSINTQIASAGPGCLPGCGANSCSTLEGVSITNITDTGFTISWSSASPATYRIRVRDVEVNQEIYNQATSSTSNLVNPGGFTRCKKYLVYAEHNCSGTYSTPVVILIEKNIQGCAFFEFQNVVDWGSRTVTFTDASTNASSRLWNFGDGNTSTQANPTHTYNNAGSYDVTLSVNSGADTYMKESVVSILPSLPTPYSLSDGGNFNDDDFGGGVLSGDIAYWEKGTGAFYFGNSTNAWITNLDGNIQDEDSRTALYSPSFDFSTAGSYTLSFNLSMHVQYANGPFALQLQYSTDEGNSWMRLGSDTDANWYERGPSKQYKIYEGIFADEMGWCSNYNNALLSYDVSFLAGSSSARNSSVIFRFEFAVSNDFQQGYARAGAMVDNFQIERQGALPVNLLYFKAKPQNDDVLIEWATSSELKNDRYELSRSADGISFTDIGSYEGSANSLSDRYYTHLDKNPLPGISYYRLKQVDHDGFTTVYGPAKVKMNATEEIEIFPTLVHSQEYINIILPEFVRGSTISLIDIRGQKVSEHRVSDVQSQVIRYDVSLISSGIYLVVVDGRNVGKIVKM